MKDGSRGPLGDETLDEKNPRNRQGLEENPAPQGLKTPPDVPVGEDSGEWTRGGGSDTNEVKRRP